MSVLGRTGLSAIGRRRTAWSGWIRSPWRLALTFGLVACASTPPAVLIALPPVALRSSPSETLSRAGRAPVLLVRRLALPEYMVSRRVRYSADAATVAEWPEAYWAERVEIGMAREFVVALRDRLPGWSVCDNDCGGATPDLTLSVTLPRLDVVRRDLRVRANARATLVAAEPGERPSRPLAAGSGSPASPLAGPDPGVRPVPTISTWTARYELPMPADSAQGEALALRDLLAVLADDSATSLGLALQGTPIAP